VSEPAPSLGKDLVGLEHLTTEQLQTILDTAEPFKEISERRIKKVPVLRGKTIVNLFFEASTRTRISFEFAEKRLSADTVNISSTGSSVAKGETLVDTARNLEAMRIDMVVIRHGASGAARFLADRIPSNVVNAGDGWHEHPTQGLLDLLTIRDHRGPLEGLKVCIVGDILHSRVARSNIQGFLKLGAEVRVAGPPTMIPPAVESLGVKAYTSLREALDGADVVMALRIQNERLGGAFTPSVREYAETFGIDRAKLRYARDDAIVMHPGPVNRGVELAHDLADHRPSVILDQVRNGVALRMAVLYLLAGRRPPVATPSDAPHEGGSK